MGGRIWIRPKGNLGNRALQFLAAQGIKQYAPDAAIENISLPEWGLVDPYPEPPPMRSATVGEACYWIDAPGLGDCLSRGVIETVFLEGYPYNLENLPPRALARRMIGGAAGGEFATGFGPAQLVCSVRGDEIMTAIHPDYILLPPVYYKKLAERSGLELVFFGQIGDDPYIASLRRECADATFVPGRNPGYDFEMLRRSANIAPSVSTFAWLAAWLSEADQVYLPVGGIFNPDQHPYINLLPLNDPTFRFTLLPFSKAVNVHQAPAKFAHSQAILGEHARPIESAELREICSRASALVPAQPRISGFDPDYYVTRYADIAYALTVGMPSALQHYLNTGFRENRMPLELDPLFYSNYYPDAAMEIAQGFFLNPLQHFIASGRSKGYLPTA